MKTETCLICKWFYFDGGSPGYSERTPGSEWDMSCRKGKWAMSGRAITQEEYRKTLLTARTCKEYSPVKI